MRSALHPASSRLFRMQVATRRQTSLVRATNSPKAEAFPSLVIRTRSYSGTSRHIVSGSPCCALLTMQPPQRSLFSRSHRKLVASLDAAQLKELAITAFLVHCNNELCRRPLLQVCDTASNHPHVRNSSIRWSSPHNRFYSSAGADCCRSSNKD